jgi:hypothetical protein
LRQCRKPEFCQNIIVGRVIAIGPIGAGVGH